MINWRKSSRSKGNAEGECVEISTNAPNATLIRDTKLAGQGPVLSLSPTEFAAFIVAIKDGDHDL